MATVRLEGITRQFGSAVATAATGIADITFEVPDGQFWVLVGPSGCGKSTVLRTIAGLEAATAGELYIGDRCVTQMPARQRDVAMVFQNYALYPHMSVAENLAFGLQMRRVNAQQRQERIVEVAKLLAIDHLLDRKPGQLSGGQQQRVALGRAIARQPQVFLLDEPLSNLDAQLRDETRAELKRLHQQVGITTIYVTHDQVEAMTLADQIVVLNQGRIQQIGDPQTIYAHPANRMIATFLGSPPMNILTATYDGTAFQINGQALPCPEALQAKLQPITGQTYDLGIRPEHLQLCADAGDLKVEISVVEPLGREVLVRARLLTESSARSSELAFQCRPDQRLCVGDRCSLTLDFDQLFVFDATTGKTLYPLNQL
ncbi:ABC transporter ATP-binding protein [Leptolyngbya sp. FACHB-321]|uniref:ABC transporter ATP-binding protein n=1 Tax=Leptolyngbya sp. FACHB-321 TaxID=2692807 RepID=UPI001682BF8C|nr:ABC transporter ATP-binding protein [Leptolyngbya sp. FACHB-321]MBD2038871.1 ABC transporter ATP-binding protein [Leptolyngbya sp. FACHB-321]